MRFMKQLLLTAIYVHSLLEVVVNCEKSSSASNRNGVRNILFFFIDDLRPEIGVYVNEDDSLFPGMQTPNIDALAGNSLRFRNAYVQVSMCGPSRASVLTGRRPDTTLVYTNTDPYWRNNSGNFTTIPQYFKENGYVAYGSGKIYHAGYDNDDAFSWTEPNYRPQANIASWYQYGVSWEMVEPNSSNISLPDTAIKEDAIERLYQVADDPDTPFFLGVGFQKPHLPWVCPSEFYDLYPEEEVYLPQNPYVPLNLPVVAWSNWSDLILWEGINITDGSYNSTPADNDTIDLRRAYYSCVSYMDSLVGEVLQKLQDLGLADSTAVVFTSDHGYHLGEHADWGKQTNFELDTHVPLMIKIPGVTDGGFVTDALVELVDVFPTLVDIVGLEPIEQCPEDSLDIDVCHEGYSMMDLFNDQTPIEWKSATFSQFERTVYQDIPSMGYSIHTPEYHYVKWLSFANQTLDLDDVIAEELYDLTSDPNETVNIAGYEEYVDIQEDMEGQLWAGWREALPPSK